MQNDPYYEKYLKYKAKYMALKEQQGGLLTLKNGVYAFFCSAEIANAICAAIHGDAPSNAKLNEILEKSGVAYRGKNGDLELSIVKESSLKKTQAKAGVLAGQAASAAGTLASQAASKAGQLASQAATKAGQLASQAAAVAVPAITKAASSAGSALSTLGRTAASSVSSGISQLKGKVSSPKRKVSLGSLPQAGGDGETPTHVTLDAPLQTSSESALREVGNKLKAINSAIDTVVVIDIKTIGKNKCLNKFSL